MHTILIGSLCIASAAILMAALHKRKRPIHSLSRGLVAWWIVDANKKWLDISGNNHHGTLFNCE